MKAKMIISGFLVTLFLAWSPDASMAQKHPVGSIKITSGQKGDFFIDQQPVLSLDIFHHVLIAGLDTGSHCLVFRHKNGEISEEIRISKGMTDTL